ncbi:hypothetical protein LMG23992_03447 [Cupriavidus laharis]|uniref:Phosphatase PAP2 family protein n=1 Tax=Cupriavidus laharis TaxID=151654 RepID=A0ABM8XB28_9BURK|nr:hypothetical protein [Cupriavidus laharis]CAG9177229.1 hypothetical protein LMG23992_03447 [Cupriavidus laharis]
MFPLAGIVAVRLAWLGLWRRAFYWLFSLGAGTLVILVGKLAFEFGGWFVPSVNVYSVSGHALLTAAVYPVLFSVSGEARGDRAARFGMFAGICVAVLAAVALVAGRYHTATETLIGMGVGLIVAWTNLRRSRRLLPAGRSPAISALVLCVVLMIVIPALLYPIRTRLWSQGLTWFGISERYARHIGTDPVSGRTVVTVVQLPLPAYRQSSELF